MYLGRRLGGPWQLATALVLCHLALYLTLFGAGSEWWSAAVVGIVAFLAVVVGAVVVVVVLAIRGPAPVWLRGTGHVVSSSAPPSDATHGHCELVVVVDAPGLPIASVKVREQRVMVTKWPEAGAALPIDVAMNNPRRVRVRWDEVLTHAEASAAEFDEHATWDEDLDIGLAPPIGPRRVLPLEDEPSSLVARYLFPTERFRGEWRRHLLRPVRGYAFVLVFVVLGIVAVRQRVRPDYVTEAVAAVCAAGAVVAVHVVLAWLFNRFALTEKRVMLVEGVLLRRVSSLPLARLVDLRLQQSTVGRVLDYGVFVVEGARWWSRLRRVTDLPNPNELYLRTMEELYDPEAAESRRTVRYDDDYDR